MKAFKKLLRTVAVAASIALTGCPTEPKQFPACRWGGMTLTTDLTSGTPVFSWTPNCRIEVFDVGYLDDTGAYAPAWRVATEGRNAIQSGVKYGVTPREATVVNPPIVLTSGKTYIILIVWAPDDSPNSHTAEFTAP